MTQFNKRLLLFGYLFSYELNAQANPSEVIAKAAQYTVKIHVLNEIAINQDSAGSRSGTGFLIDKERGWILTNAHVATRSPSTIKVSFNGSGQQVEAKRIHVDSYIDLAVLSVPPQSLPVAAKQASLDCGGSPTTGSSVMAYGHPWGLSYTASRGIISGSAWMFPSQLIQTDAQINSGNSGGPLISLDNGKVVGINSSSYKPSGDKNATAISLAEPIAPICKVIDLLKSGGDTRLKMLPVAFAVAEEGNKPKVSSLYDTKYGFALDDTILRVNGGPVIKNMSDLFNQLRGLDKKADITLLRGKDEVKVTTPLIVAPDPLEAKSINFSGLVISTPWTLDSREGNPEGHLIIDWIEDSEEAGITDASISDYLVSVDGRSFSDVEKLYIYLDSLQENDEVSIILNRTSSASEFNSEYRHILLKKTKLHWVKVN